MNTKDSLSATKATLDRLNAALRRVTRRDLRNGNPPSIEHKATYKAATVAWREWCNAIDADEGKSPTFHANTSSNARQPQPHTP